MKKKNVLLGRKYFRMLDKMNISAYTKLKLTFGIRKIKNITYSKKDKENLALCPTNEDYGHEYWIKKYANYTGLINGLIEHGLYFGRNSNKEDIPLEYETGNILTYGKYREEILHKAFPEMKVIPIGPRIAYAQTDEAYRKQIMDNQPSNARTLTVFPGHSVVTDHVSYDISLLMHEASEVCKKHNLNNIQVCLHYADIQIGADKSFLKEGLKVVSAGENWVSFLPRLRAIIESSVLTMSNELGTSLGYCIFLGKQHILIPQKIVTENSDREEVERITSDNVPRDYLIETQQFAKMFSSDCDLAISKEQYEFCDYFWGYEYIRDVAEMNKILRGLEIRKK